MPAAAAGPHATRRPPAVRAAGRLPHPTARTRRPRGGTPHGPPRPRPPAPRFGRGAYPTGIATSSGSITTAPRPPRLPRPNRQVGAAHVAPPRLSSSTHLFVDDRRIM